MEQEIAELKTKLAHAESLVQELQSEEARWERGTEGKVNIGMHKSRLIGLKYCGKEEEV